MKRISFVLTLVVVLGSIMVANRKGGGHSGGIDTGTHNSAELSGTTVAPPDGPPITGGANGAGNTAELSGTTIAAPDTTTSVSTGTANGTTSYPNTGTTTGSNTSGVTTGNTAELSGTSLE